jgi:hypothetical protein
VCLKFFTLVEAGKTEGIRVLRAVFFTARDRVAVVDKAVFLAVIRRQANRQRVGERQVENAVNRQLVA